MKYAYINESTNQLLGWYDDNIHTTIPTPNVEVTNTQWQTAIDNNCNKINDDGSGEVYDFRTDDEITADETATSIATSKAYLTSTDWVVVKINESRIQGEDITDLLMKYADVLIARTEARTNINNLER